jgi:uncharacterized linocin/CFP29 family protein
MNGPGRDEAPFTARVWQEIDQTIAAVRAANCTARRFLETDGPYGLGLTSVAGDEGWLASDDHGADYRRWNLTRPPEREPDAEPSGVGTGTYLVRGSSRPVPLIASEFELGMRAIEAYDTGCQPLDLCRATRAARDLALEEERLVYYGSGDDSDALLRVVPVRIPTSSAVAENATRVGPNNPIGSLHDAIEELTYRGYAGPFALTVEPRLYRQLYTPNADEDTLRVDLLRRLFRCGIHLAPVINPADGRRGAIVTVGRAYSRLVVGQDWVTTYRGRDGVLHRFLLITSLQLRVCDPLSIQVLVGEGWPEPTPPAISGYQTRARQPLDSAVPGTEVEIVGSNLDSAGTVVFRNNIYGMMMGAASISRWTNTAIRVTVPAPWPPSYQPFPWAGPVVVTTAGGQTVEGPEFTIRPPEPAPE